jgi:hypothetical protein
VPEALAQYAGRVASQRLLKRIAENFAWVQQAARLRRTRHRRLARVSAVFPPAVTAYSLVRLPKLFGAVA